MESEGSLPCSVEPTGLKNSGLKFYNAAPCCAYLNYSLYSYHCLYYRNFLYSHSGTTSY